MLQNPIPLLLHRVNKDESALTCHLSASPVSVMRLQVGGKRPALILLLLGAELLHLPLQRREGRGQEDRSGDVL